MRAIRCTETKGVMLFFSFFLLASSPEPSVGSTMASRSPLEPDVDYENSASPRPSLDDWLGPSSPHDIVSQTESDSLLGLDDLLTAYVFDGTGGVAYDSNPTNVFPRVESFDLAAIPSGAVIEKAYLWITGYTPSLAQPITLTFNGVPLGSKSPTAQRYCGGAWSAIYAVDVTAYVTGNGFYTYLTENSPASRHGDFLAVVYSSPSAPARRIQVNYGAAHIGGPWCGHRGNATFSGVTEGLGDLVLFTQADDYSIPSFPSESYEEVYFNGLLIDSGPIFERNDGNACSTVTYTQSLAAGTDYVTVDAGADWMTWNVAILVGPPADCTAGFGPLQIRRVPTHYPTIQSAVDAAGAGELILIEPDDPLNPYRENIVISGILKANLTIKACEPNTVNLTSAPSSSLPILEATEADGLLIENINFHDGSAGSGAAISATNLTGLDIRTCGFSGNSSAGYGGAVSVVDCEDVRIQDSWFEGNTAGGNGGAISFLRPGREMTIMRSRFTSGNSAGADGGAISVVDGKDVAGGGGLRIYGGRPSSSYSIADNEALNGLGGGIYVRDSWALIGDPAFVPDPTGDQFDLMIERNVSLMGGGIAAQGAVLGSAWEHHSDGPLVVCDAPPSIPSTTGYVSVNWSMLAENQATWGGGGIAAADVTGILGICNTTGFFERYSGIRLDVSNSYIFRNTVTGVVCSTWPYVGDTRGGGIYYSGGESYGSTVGSTLIHLNRSLAPGPADSGDGGGLSLNNYAQACIRDTTFTGNTAGDDGGGLDLAAFSRASVVGGAMAGNISEKNGGGLHATCSSRAHVVDTVFESNVANLGRGGGLFVREAELTMLGSGRIVHNKAGQGGGGLMFWGHNLEPGADLCITRGIEHLLVDAVYEFRYNEAGVGLCPGCIGNGGAILVEREAPQSGMNLPDLSMDLRKFVASDNIADSRVGVGAGPFGDGVVIAGLEDPQRFPGEPPWQGAQILNATFLAGPVRLEPESAALGLVANFNDSLTDLAVSGSYFQDGKWALYAHSSRFRVDATAGLVQLMANQIGIRADSCVSGVGEPPAAVVDGVDFEGHGVAATSWTNSVFSLKNSLFLNDLRAVHILNVLRTGELRRNDFRAGLASGWGIDVFLANPVGPPPSSLPGLMVKQNDFQGYEPAPARLAIRLVSPTPPPCGGGSVILDATDNWWGCPDWIALPFQGGPVTTCGSPPGFPPCADISVIPPGVQFFDWSHSPNVP